MVSRFMGAGHHSSLANTGENTMKFVFKFFSCCVGTPRSNHISLRYFNGALESHNYTCSFDFGLKGKAERTLCYARWGHIGFNPDPPKIIACEPCFLIKIIFWTTTFLCSSQKENKKRNNQIDQVNAHIESKVHKLIIESYRLNQSPAFCLFCFWVFLTSILPKLAFGLPTTLPAKIILT